MPKMRTIQVGKAELLVVRHILEAAENGGRFVRLTAKSKTALRTFLRRLSLAD